MRGTRGAGFSLVELMITLAVLAVVMAIAFPSYKKLIRSNQLATATNELVASMALARSEAQKNGRGAGICASSGGTGCDGESWGAGWMVWSDRNGDGDFSDGDDVLRFTAGNPEIKGSAADLDIVYGSRGIRRSDADQQVLLYLDECGTDKLQRKFVVAKTGQVRVTQESCS